MYLFRSDFRFSLSRHSKFKKLHIKELFMQKKSKESLEEKNFLLVHGVDNGKNSEIYDPNSDRIIPEIGFLKGSVVVPKTQATYEPRGLVLKYTGFDKASYRGVGFEQFYSFREEINGLRGKVFEPGDVSFPELIFLSLVNNTHNEGVVIAENTEVIGVYGEFENEEDFVEEVILKLEGEVSDTSRDVSKDLSYRTLANALLGTSNYVNLGEANYNRKAGVSEKLIEHYNNFFGENGHNNVHVSIPQLVEELEKEEDEESDLLDESKSKDGLVDEDIVGYMTQGEFDVQRITEKSKGKLRHAIRT